MTIKQMIKMDYLEYIENNIIDCNAGYRGGSIKVNVAELFPEITDEQPIIGAYQNYLGGGMLGAVVGASQFNFDDLTAKHKVIAERLKLECKLYLHNQTNHEDEWETSTFDENQTRSISAY